MGNVVRAQNELGKHHNQLVGEVRRLASAVGALHQRNEVDIQKSIVKDIYGQATVQARAIIGVGYVALIATWRALRPELGDTMFRWVGLLSLASVVAFVTHEVIKIILTQLHYRRVVRAIDSEKAVLNPSDVRALFKLIDGRLFRVWAIMMWIMVVPGVAAAALLFYGLIASVVD